MKTILAFLLLFVASCRMATEPASQPSAVGTWIDTSASNLELIVNSSDTAYFKEPKMTELIPATSRVTKDSLFVTTGVENIAIYSMAISADSLHGIVTYGEQSASVVFYRVAE